MNKLFAALLVFILAFPAFSTEIAKVRVYKADRKLILLDKFGKHVKTYSIMLGRVPVGHKQMEGDNKTPEGAYLLDYKNPKSKYYKSIHVNYPNKFDLANAKRLGIKNPGGEIMLHGLPNQFGDMMETLALLGMDGAAEDIIRLALPFIDWTQGCIALIDSDMEEIYNLVKVPTQIFIYP